MAVGTDVKLVELSTHPGVYDLQLDKNGDIATEDSFDTAIYVSLFTEARATADQIARPELRRGWIGNERTPGFQIGSLLWLFEQRRLTLETATGIAREAEAALLWMVARGYALSISAKLELQGPREGLLEVSVTKPDGTVETALFDLWALTGLTFGEPV